MISAYDEPKKPDPAWLLFAAMILFGVGLMMGGCVSSSPPVYYCAPPYVAQHNFLTGETVCVISYPTYGYYYGPPAVIEYRSRHYR